MTEAAGGWSPKMLSQFLAMNAARPQSDFRKTKFFDMLGADALALLTAFLEVKSPAAQQFFYQSPWPGRNETTLIPGSERWKDRVREYVRQAMLYANNHTYVPSRPGSVVPTPNISTPGPEGYRGGPYVNQTRPFPSSNLPIHAADQRPGEGTYGASHDPGAPNANIRPDTPLFNS